MFYLMLHFEGVGDFIVTEFNHLKIKTKLMVWPKITNKVRHFI